MDSEVIETERRTCETCRDLFAAQVVVCLGCRILARHCPRCVEKHLADQAARAAASAAGAPAPTPEERWALLCPPEFRTETEGVSYTGGVSHTGGAGRTGGAGGAGIVGDAGGASSAGHAGGVSHVGDVRRLKSGTAVLAVGPAGILPAVNPAGGTPTGPTGKMPVPLLRRPLSDTGDVSDTGIVSDTGSASHASGGRTSIERLQRECPKLPVVLAWRLGARGLMLRGSTGTGKTRAMWRLLRRLFDEGRSIEALTAGEFGRSYADAAGQYRASAWFERLAAVDVLFVDDLGKGCWSEAVRAVFFDLIDKRTRFGRPVLITTNDTGPELSERMRDVNLGDPLVRRLREFCEVLKF